jgi:hypothetical protein
VTLTKIELSWAAGLFEGEGCVTIAVRNRDDTFRILCTVSSTDSEIIDFFCDRWKGWRQPVYGERPGRKPAWTWTVSGPGAEAFIRDIMPWIRTDRVMEKFEVALEFRSFQSRGSKRYDPEYKDRQRHLYELMKQLNQRGIPKEVVA